MLLLRVFRHEVFGVCRNVTPWPTNLPFVTPALNLAFMLLILLRTWLYFLWPYPPLLTADCKWPHSFPCGEGWRRRGEMSNPTVCIFPLGTSRHLKDAYLIYTSLAKHVKKQNPWEIWFAELLPLIEKREQMTRCTLEHTQEFGQVR